MLRQLAGCIQHQERRCNKGEDAKLQLVENIQQMVVKGNVYGMELEAQESDKGFQEAWEQV